MTSPRPFAVDLDAVRFLAEGLRIAPGSPYRIDPENRIALADALDAVCDAAALHRAADIDRLKEALHAGRVEITDPAYEEFKRTGVLLRNHPTGKPTDRLSDAPAPACDCNAANRLAGTHETWCAYARHVKARDAKR